MKNLFKILIGLLLFCQVNLTAQVGVGPAPYCMPLYSQIPCNQPNPSNTAGNFINDFIHSYNTNGATTNIVNNGSGCNAQNLSGIKNYRLWGCQYYMVCSPGQVITSNFQSGNTFAQGCTVFVDWNNDGVYNPITERMTSAPGVPPAAVMTPMPAWVVPAVAPGQYRMRVRCAYFTTGNTIDPCLNYGYGETEEYYVYVNTQPAGIITATLGVNSPICTGNTLSLTAVASGTAPNTYTYTWTGPNSFTSSAINPTIAATTSLQSGIYTVNINPGACAITQTIQVYVNPTPTINSITNNGPVCQGSNIFFNANVLTSGTPSYSWVGPNSFTSNIQNPSITNSIPANTGTYNFTVTNTYTNGGQCKATGNSSVSVVPVNAITVTPSYTLCQGSNLNLIANVAGASSYSWTGPNSFTSNVQNPLLTGVTPVNSGAYNITAAFTNSTSTLTCNSTAVITLSVVAMNPVTPWATYNICQGSLASFSASAAGSPTYSWTGPNNFTSTNQMNNIPNALPNISGNYTVNAIFSIGSVSCVTSNFTTINVVPVNTITVVPNITICNGQSTQLTANAPGAISYTWNGPSSFSVAQPVATLNNLNPTWSGIYTVTAAFTNGALTCYNTNSTNLLVKPDIQFSLTPIGKLCYNQALNVVGPNGATSYTWNGPGFSSNLQNLIIPNTGTVNIGTYTLTVDLNGCKTSSSIFVDVNDPITWKSTPPNLTLCKGDSFTLTAEANGGSGNYAYNWNPYYNITGPTGSVQVGTAQGTTYYNITVYDIACPQYTINHTTILTVNRAPIPNLAIANQACEPYCTIYNSHVKNQSNFVSYTFNGNQTFLDDSTNICLNAGSYSLNITTTGLNGCTETFSYPNMITVYPKPNADFDWNPSNPNTVSEPIVTFNPVNQSNTSTYFWELDANVTSTEKNPTYNYQIQNSYPVTLVVITEHGCKDTVTKVLDIRDEFILYVPNAFTPNGDGLNDTFRPKGLGIVTYEMHIFDRWGNIIFTSKDFNKGWDGTFKGLLCQDDVYVWKITAIDNNKIRHEKTGHVTLLK